MLLFNNTDAENIKTLFKFAALFVVIPVYVVLYKLTIKKEKGKKKKVKIILP